MRALLVHPKTPPTYWGFQHSLPIAGKAASLPPLGTKVAIVGDSLTAGVTTRMTPFAAQYGFDAKIDAFGYIELTRRVTEQPATAT